MSNFYGQFTVWVSVSSVLKFQACDISSVQASKGDTFTEALYMENALMQQPSRI